ncbi:MAG: hypothetical protein MJZ07_03165 [Bacteroidales bacterium]|nr:hypothetical protein [Bacteroidales bacterium]
MLNRRILRIKAFKVLYSTVFCQDSQTQMTIRDIDSALEQSCEAVRDLYILMLGTVAPLTRIANERIEAASRKINRTEEDLNPNRKFADNALATFLLEEPDFKKIWKKKFPKFDWNQYDLILKDILNDIAAKDWYRSYMASETVSLAEDCKLFTKIFEEEFVDNEALAEMLEDMSLLWNDDLAYALTCCCRSFETIAKTGRWSFPPLYQSEIMAKEGKEVESDKDFTVRLLHNAYSSYPKYSDLLSGMVSKFEKDRLVSTDVCLMVCCLAEIMNFPSIPARVSINEYVEISKFYGTPKSSVFVNGLLDKAARKLLAEGNVNKTI